MNLFDQILTYFSPSIGLKRSLLRERLQKRSQYAAAQSNRLTGSWSPLNESVNDIISQSSSQVRARVRQLVRDFPYFSRAVNSVVEYVVGSGIQFQSRVIDAQGRIKSKTVQMIEDEFRGWADNADITGKLHYYELMQLAKRQELECGEFLIIKRYPKKNRIPFALQMIEPDWLSADFGKSSAGADISQGIEFSLQSGEILAYHITDPDSWGKSVRVPAVDIIHGFQTLRPGQLRGISPLVSGVLLSNSLSELMDAELDAAKMAAKWLSFVTTPDIESMQSLVTTEDSQKIEELQNGIIQYLQPGEEINFAANPRPGSNFPPYVRLILNMFSVVAGIPYEIISGDYTGINYNTARTSRMDFVHLLRPTVDRHIRQFCKPTAAGFFEKAVIIGALQFPDYWRNPEKYQRSDWQWAGVEYVDPLKESKSHIDQINANLRSPFEVVAGRGRDLEEVYIEIARAKELKEKYGLTDEEVSTAMQTNPAAIEEQKALRIIK